MGVVGSTEARPTQQSLETFTMLNGALDVELKRVKRSLDETLPKVNAVLRAAGLPLIVPSTEEPKPTVRPAVVMDDENDLKTKW